MNTLLASCPNCKRSLRVVVGRKATTRRTTCEVCGNSYLYSAWKLKTPRASGGVSLRTFYQVDLFRLVDSQKEGL